MIKAWLIYLISGLVNRSVPLLLLPILTVYLAPEEFGRVALFQLALQFFVAICGLSLAINVTRNFYSHDKYEQAVLIFNLMFILICSCALGVLLLALLRFFELIPFGYSTYWLVMLPICAFFGTLSAINLALLRARERPYFFGALQLGNSFVNVSLTLALVVILNYGWEGRLAAIFATLVASGMVGVIATFLQGYIRMRLDGTVIREVLSVSVPLVPHGLAGLAITMIDRAFIGEMVGLADVGIYSVGYSVGMVVMLFTNSFANAWAPWFYKNIDQKHRRPKIVTLTYLFIIGFGAVAFLYAIFARKVLPFFVSEQYLGAIEYIPWICLAYFFFGIYQMHFPYLVHAKKTRLITLVTLSAACVNIVANYVLISLYGTIGAAYATVIAYMVSALLIVVFSRSAITMPWRISIRDMSSALGWDR